MTAVVERCACECLSCCLCVSRSPFSRDANKPAALTLVYSHVYSNPNDTEKKNAAVDCQTRKLWLRPTKTKKYFANYFVLNIGDRVDRSLTPSCHAPSVHVVDCSLKDLREWQVRCYLQFVSRPRLELAPGTKSCLDQPTFL